MTYFYSIMKKITWFLFNRSRVDRRTRRSFLKKKAQGEKAVMSLTKELRMSSSAISKLSKALQKAKRFFFLKNL